MRDHDPFWVKKRLKLMADDPSTAEREYDCIPRSAEGSFFDADAVDAAIDDNIKPTYLKSTCGIDLGFANDASALVITERQGAHVAVAHLEMDSPKPGQRLVPTVVCNGFALTAAKFHSDFLVADGVYIESAREAARRHHLPVIDGPSIKGDKDEAHIYLRSLLREGKIKIPNDRRLVGQLKSYIAVHQSGGGIRFVPPRVQGNHCDLVASLINAVWHDRRFGQIIGGVPDNVRPSFVRREGENVFFNSSSVHT